MGWLYMQSLGPHSGPRQYLDHQLTYETPERRVRLLRSAVVAMRTYYAAIEIVDAQGTREVTAVVCLVRYNPGARDGYIFGYKDMDEGMGPCEADCPPGILDLLTPTEAPYAIAWRERCRASAARRAGRPRPRAGQTIVLDAPITFRDGARADRLQVVKDPGHPRALRFAIPGRFGLYGISGLANRHFRVED